MHFCNICNNMYYIRLENEENEEVNSNKLIYYCRNCGNIDKSYNINNIVINKVQYKNNDKNFNNVINEYTYLDNTLPRTDKIDCPNENCETNIKKIPKEIIYIRYDDINIKYAYLCSTCKITWKSE